MTTHPAAHDRIRLFGAANVMAMTELEQVEREYGIQILPRRDPNQPKTDPYYLQFDEAVRKEARRMAHVYETFYCLEQTMRSLVTLRLQEGRPTDWWEKSVPDAIKTEVAERIQREIDSGVTRRSEENLDYTTFGELGQIILHNWTIFGDTFSSKKAVEKVMASLNNLRGPIAHCSPLADDEVLRLSLSVKDWFRLME